VTYSLHPEAERDLADGLDFYSTHAGPTVARRFLEEFQRITELLVEHPGLGTPTGRGRRTYPLQVFPYSVVYRGLAGSVRILVVRHQHRKPSHGAGRR
jgi:plasmid stabilization system protein ParE